MRLNTVLKVLGVSAALAMPFALVGCDDDDEKTTDAAPKDGSVDAPGGTDVAPKTDTTVTPDGAPDAKRDATAGDASGDAANAG